MEKTGDEDIDDTFNTLDVKDAKDGGKCKNGVKGWWGEGEG